MPSAVPYQTGLIGIYNNSSSPGVYVSWDAEPSSNSAYSIIFKSTSEVPYRFPLVVNRYSDVVTGNPVYFSKPIDMAAGRTHVYVITENEFVVLEKSNDDFDTVYNTDILSATFDLTEFPDSIKIGYIENQEIIMLGYGALNTIKVYIFDGSTLTYFSSLAYSAITGLAITDFTGSYFEIDTLRLYVTYQGAVYAANFVGTEDDITVDTLTPGIVVDSTNGIITGNTLTRIAQQGNQRLAVVDSANGIYEFLYQGNVDSGNVATQWTLNWYLEATDQTWSNIRYNHFGILISTDSTNDTVNVIVPTNVDYETSLSGYSFTDAGTVPKAASIVNSIGESGTAYMQFNTPIAVIEDPAKNIIVFDYNNRLTYIPADMDYVSTISAPLKEYIDDSGNPAYFYYIKQTDANYNNAVALPPISAEELLLRSSVLYELNALLKVPVYDEEPLFDYNRTSAKIAYGDLVTDPAPQVRITASSNQGQNSPMRVLSPYTGIYDTLSQSTDDPFNAPAVNLNYPNGLFYRFNNEGMISFMDANGDATSIQEYDTLLVSYYVKMFTNRQINNALYLALQSINAQPGVNKIQNVADAPFWYDAALVSGAVFYLIRQLLIGLNQRERRLLVMDPESGSFDAVANLKDLARMYQEDFGKLLEKLPLAKRPFMGTITVPEFALPGGRSRLFRYLWKGGGS